MYVDEREKNSRVPMILTAKGVTIIFKMLEVGDYLVNNVVGIERKTANDYVNSLIDGRLFEQLSRLKERYEKAILVVEGSIHKAIKSRSIHRNAILGSYISVALDLGVYLVHTKDEEETAELIKRIALHKIKSVKSVNMQSVSRKPKSGDVAEWQKFILQCFPHIGPKIAQRILEHFGSLYAFCNASPQELSRIEGLNEQRAGEIHKIIHALYKEYVKDRLSKADEQQRSILDYVSTDR